MRFNGFAATISLTFVILLVISQVQFASDWDAECDYKLKIWVTVWITTNAIFFAAVAPDGAKCLDAIAFLILLFLVAFWFYGINPVLVDGDSSCNGSTLKWGLGLWYTMCVMVFFVFLTLVALLLKGSPPDFESSGDSRNDAIADNQHVSVDPVHSSGDAHNEEHRQPTLVDAGVQVYGSPSGTSNDVHNNNEVFDGEQAVAAERISTTGDEDSSSTAKLGVNISTGVPVLVTPPSQGYGKCAICLENLEGEAPCRATPCGHRFHQVCIYGWLSVSEQDKWRMTEQQVTLRRSCPECRAPVN